MMNPRAKTARGFFSKILLFPMLWLQCSVVCRGEEAGAGFGYMGQLVVSQNTGGWIAGGEITEQSQQGSLLGLCTGVGRVALFVQASFIADAYGYAVEALGMGTTYVFWEHLYHFSTLPYIVVVGGLAESLTPCGDQCFGTEGAVCSCSGAVDY